jgi:protein SDA1
VKGANARQRNDRLNRALQNFLYACMGAEGEASAKPALAVLTELWRRQVWRDARTVNVIGARRAPAAPIPWTCGDTLVPSEKWQQGALGLRL